MKQEDGPLDEKDMQQEVQLCKCFSMSPPDALGKMVIDNMGIQVEAVARKLLTKNSTS